MLEDYLTSKGTELVTLIKDELIKRKKVVTKETLNSIILLLVENNNSVGLKVDYDFVLQLIDKGINGSEQNNGSPFTQSKMLPTQALTPWLKAKGIPLNKAFPIAKSIFKKGYKGEFFLDKLIEDFQKDFIENLPSVLIQDIKKEFNN